MIIVSQDKKGTVENLNLGIRNAGEYNRNYTIYNTKIGVDLGEYKTEEKAKEVLEEIYTYKGIFELFKVASSKVKEEMAKDFQEDGIVFDTYEMPKEE